MTSLANDFEPSSAAASALGPKHGMPAARTASATPATSGASGPTTTRSAATSRASAATSSPSVAVTSCSVASAAIPGLPGRGVQLVLTAPVQRADDGVLARARTDDEDPHGAPA